MVKQEAIGKLYTGNRTSDLAVVWTENVGLAVRTVRDHGYILSRDKGSGNKWGHGGRELWTDAR